VQEVHVEPVDRRGELRERVQLRLPRPPVEAAAPVVGQLAQLLDRHAPAPAVAGQLGRPPGTGQTVAQVVEVGVGDVDPERRHADHRRSQLGQDLSQLTA
jgi:hypothetical protein